MNFADEGPRRLSGEPWRSRATDLYTWHLITLSYAQPPGARRRRRGRGTRRARRRCGPLPFRGRPERPSGGDAEAPDGAGPQPVPQLGVHPWARCAVRGGHDPRDRRGRERAGDSVLPVLARRTAAGYGPGRKVAQGLSDADVGRRLHPDRPGPRGGTRGAADPPRACLRHQGGRRGGRQGTRIEGPPQRPRLVDRGRRGAGGPPPVDGPRARTGRGVAPPDARRGPTRPRRGPRTHGRRGGGAGIRRPPWSPPGGRPDPGPEPPPSPGGPA